jgi:hypothetical protein
MLRKPKPKYPDQDQDRIERLENALQRIVRFSEAEQRANEHAGWRPLELRLWRYARVMSHVGEIARKALTPC